MKHLKARQFWHNTAGNFSLIGAISLTTAVSIMGLGLDAQRGYVLKTDLQSAVDAAAISGALVKSGLGDTATFGERRKAALTTLQGNIEGIELASPPVVNIDPSSGEVRVEAEAQTNHLIMSLFGHKNQSVYAEGKAAYGTDTNVINTLLSDPSEISAHTPVDEIKNQSNLNNPLSIAFVLDNSTSLLNEFTGDLNPSLNQPTDGSGGPSEPEGTAGGGAGGGLAAQAIGGLGGGGGGDINTPISRLDIIKNSADEYYNTLETMARTNPVMRQNIRTGLMPFNDGLDRRFQVGLQPGWARTSAQTKIMQPKRRKLPVQSFKTAVRQLNNAPNTNSPQARRAIVFMGDGKFDIGFNRRTETQRLINNCQRAKEDGIEIYVMALDVSDSKALNPYQICASPNGSISGYGQNQDAIDTACLAANNAPQQANCRLQKTEYFSQIKSRSDLDDFWARLNPARRPAPDSRAANTQTQGENREASVRLVE